MRSRRRDNSHLHIAELLQTSRIIIDEGHAGIRESKDASNQIAVLIDDKYLREKITQDLINPRQDSTNQYDCALVYVDADVFANYYFEHFSIDKQTQEQYLEKILSVQEIERQGGYGEA